MDEHTLVDILYRSRETLLKKLAADGYNTKPYMKFGYDDIKNMKMDDAVAMRMDLDRERQIEEGEPTKCVVVYTAPSRRLKATVSMNKFLSEQVIAAKPPKYPQIEDTASTEVIIILSDETVTEQFHAFALQVLRTKKLRLRFFQASHIVNDPSSYAIVPKHRKLLPAEKEKLLKELYLETNEAKKLPVIRFHEDMQARWLGLVPDDVVEITRPSPSAGEYMMYRVCST